MDSTTEIFEMVKASCQNKLTASAYSLWIKDIECQKLNHKEAVLIVSNDLRKQVIEAKYNETLSNAFIEILGFPVDITILIKDAPEKPPMPKDDISIDFASQVNMEYTFDTFIVGASNKFAHAASLAVATNPCASSYNPLFIYGNSGLGKTHLLNAICAEINKNRPDFLITYVKGEDFTNEMITAIRLDKIADFKNKYRKADVLLIDDIQFISGKERTQDEFFHTFNTLFEAKKQIVLASDRPPKEMKTLEDRLRSRFEMGLIADIQPPDYETRVAILKRKAEQLNFSLPDDVTEYIASKLKNNIRQLEGTIKKIDAFKRLTNSEPSISIAENAIRDILSDSQPLSVIIDRIISETSRYFEVSADDIRSMDRTAAIATARQAAIYIVREVTHLSMKEIGKEFSGRDHSTIVYTLTQTKKLIEKNEDFRNKVEDIIKNVRDN